MWFGVNVDIVSGVWPTDAVNTQRITNNTASNTAKNDSFVLRTVEHARRAPDNVKANTKDENVALADTEAIGKNESYLPEGPKEPEHHPKDHDTRTRRLLRNGW